MECGCRVCSKKTQNGNAQHRGRLMCPCSCSSMRVSMARRTRWWLCGVPCRAAQRVCRVRDRVPVRGERWHRTVARERDERLYTSDIAS